MKQSAMLTVRPPARRRAFGLFGLGLLLLALALALPAGALAATISTISPDYGAVGTIVNVWGSGLRDTTLVELANAPVNHFAVLDDDHLQFTVPAGAVSGRISVTIPSGTVVSAGSFHVTGPKVDISVYQPTGTHTYVQGTSLVVTWSASKEIDFGEFGVGVSGPARGWVCDGVMRAIGGPRTSYMATLTLSEPVGSDYRVMVGWRSSAGIGLWSSFGTSPGSFALTTGSAAKAITAFSFQGLTPPVTGDIDEAAHRIALGGTSDVHALVATFTTTGASVAVGGTPQVSGKTANDFGSPVTYTVTAADGSTQDYVVTVRALAIGDYYGGGRIFYLLQSGDPGYSATVQHGLSLAPRGYDLKRWALLEHDDTSVPGGTGTAIGSGAANTAKIIAQNGASRSYPAYAAEVAHACTRDGYRDWYLPSKDELNKLYLYLNRDESNDSPTTSVFWSSSENGADGAWAQGFGDGGQRVGSKSVSYEVRAVRSF